MPKYTKRWPNNFIDRAGQNLFLDFIQYTKARYFADFGSKHTGIFHAHNEYKKA